MGLQSFKESNLVQQISLYYQKLSPRDQTAVSVLSVFALFIVILFVLVLPVTHYNSSAQKSYLAGLDTLNWMKSNQYKFVGSQQTKVTRDPGQSLLGIANSTSKKFNISFKRFEPEGDNGLSLWLDDIAFNNMIVWLEMLDKRYGIQVKDISVDRQGDKGLVNARLVLQG